MSKNCKYVIFDLKRTATKVFDIPDVLKSAAVRGHTRYWIWKRDIELHSKISTILVIWEIHIGKFYVEFLCLTGYRATALAKVGIDLS